MSAYMDSGHGLLHERKVIHASPMRCDSFIDSDIMTELTPRGDCAEASLRHWPVEIDQCTGWFLLPVVPSSRQ